MRLPALALGLLIVAAGSASAAPPPLPIAVTVVSPYGPDHHIHENHYAALVPTLAQDGWFALHTPTAPDAAAAMACASWDEPDREGCLRSLPRPGGPVPSVILMIVPEGTIKVRATCIGPGAGPADPDRQRVEIDYKRLLFATEKGRQADRQALAQCLIAARGETPAPPGPKPFRATDDAAWTAALAELHKLRRLAAEHAQFLYIMPTADPTRSRHQLNLISNMVMNGPLPSDFGGDDPAELPTAMRRWVCLMDLRTQIFGDVMGASMLTAPPSTLNSAAQALTVPDLRKPRPGCAGVVAEDGDAAAPDIALIQVDHIGYRHAADSPCSFQGRIMAVERGGAIIGRNGSFDAPCPEMDAKDGHGLYRLRRSAAGEVLSVERLSKEGE